jgi:hypothetical protein
VLTDNLSLHFLWGAYVSWHICLLDIEKNESVDFCLPFVLLAFYSKLSHARGRGTLLSLERFRIIRGVIGL